MRETQTSADYGFISVTSVVKTAFPLLLELLEQFCNSHGTLFAAGNLRGLADGG
jgi:hypothetical protein